ncbi:MAG: hypothetical protein SFZ02_12440 [bacterium]|nr:hypothetical protein [bacterium]
MPLPPFNEEVVVFEFSSSNANPPEKNKIVFKKMDNMTAYFFEQGIKEFQNDSLDMYELACATYLVYMTTVYADFYIVEDGKIFPYFGIKRYLDGTYVISDSFPEFHKKFTDIPFSTATQIFGFAFQANPDCLKIVQDNTPPIQKE